MSGYIGRPPVASDPERRQTPEKPYVKRWPGALAGWISLAAVLALGGCGQNASINPVRWWQGLQGGVLAQQRPPPPGADMPYPNLGTVPKKPAMPDPAARQKVFGGLTADRASAQYEAKLIPIPVPPHAGPTAGPLGVLPGGAPAATPAAAGAGGAAPGGGPAAMPAAAGGAAPGGAAAATATAADQSSASASLDAATAPPRPAAPPAKPGTKTAAAGPPELPPMTPINTGPMPDVPLVPPPPPSLSGYVIPLTRPTPPPVPPPEAPKPDKLTGTRGQPVALGFLPNSAVLTPADIGAIKALVAKRGAHKVEAVGFGDADDATPQVQAEGIDLALARARAITAALNTYGVPPQAVRMSAEASGRGGAARLID